MTRQKEHRPATHSRPSAPRANGHPTPAPPRASAPTDGGTSTADGAKPIADGAAPTAGSPVASPADGQSSLKSSLSVLSTLGPPVTVVSALMLYFGWARTAEEARDMGLDVSLFGYSTQDYILRSISSLYLPLLGLGGLALGWLALHQNLVQRLARPDPHRPLQIAGRIVLAAGLLTAIFVVWWATAGDSFLLLPLLLSVAVAAGAYGGWLAGAAVGPRAGPVRLPWERALRTLLVSIVIALALFWQLSIYAGVVGRGYAQQTAQQVPLLPRATAFSAVPLRIEAPGVVEQEIDPGPSPDKDTPRYRITGLRLLTVSGGRIFLLHDGWTPQHGTVIVLPDDQRVRWQFSR